MIATVPQIGHDSFLLRVFQPTIDSLLYSILRALIRCVFCVTEKEINFNYVDVMLLYCGQQRMGEERGVYRVLVGKPEGRRPLGRPRCRWVDNIRMDL